MLTAPTSRALFAAGLGLLVGCTTHDTPAAPDPAAAPESAAERDERTVASAPTPTPSGPRIELVGLVHEGGTRVCEAETFDERWIDRHWQVGWTPLVVNPELDAKLPGLKGRVVKVTGRVSSGPPTLHGPREGPTNTGMCPEYQMRSDWVVTLEGMRIPRGHGPKFDAFTVDALEVIDPVQATVADDDVSVAVTNPFDAELRGVEVVAHYEGCYGKPGATLQTWRVGKLAAEASAGPHAFPTIVTNDANPRGSEYALRSLELVGNGTGAAPGVFLDLDIPSGRLDVAVACPRG